MSTTESGPITPSEIGNDQPPMRPDNDAIKLAENYLSALYLPNLPTDLYPLIMKRLNTMTDRKIAEDQTPPDWRPLKNRPHWQSLDHSLFMQAYNDGYSGWYMSLREIRPVQPVAALRSAGFVLSGVGYTVLWSSKMNSIDEINVQDRDAAEANRQKDAQRKAKVALYLADALESSEPYDPAKQRLAKVRTTRGTSEVLLPHSMADYVEAASQQAYMSDEQIKGIVAGDLPEVSYCTPYPNPDH